jgi:osmotically-inducible protein OsmY
MSLALVCGGAFAADPPAGNPPAMRPPLQAPGMHGQSGPDANNTGMNDRDKTGATVTPQDQSNNESDRKLLSRVRSAIVDDKMLSSAAHNVKMLVEDGVVTLRGPVASVNEKATVEKLARNVVGVVRVDNLLDVKTN